MSRYRVLLTDLPWGNATIERRILATIDAEAIEAPSSDEATLVACAADVDAIAACWAPVTAAVVNAAPRCRVICRMGIGLDNIDVGAATAIGIPVTNVPDYCVDEVAEHTLALLFALARNVAYFHEQTKRGLYALESAPPMQRLKGRTLGLLGLGHIGSAVAVRARCLGLRLLARTRSGDDRGTGCKMVDWETLLAESDFLSLHAPLTAQTRHVIGAEALAKLKPGACLINTSRGGLIDTIALTDAMAAGRLAGAALDVFEIEPPDLTAPLFRDPRVIVTPHAAFVSQQSLIELRERVARQLVEALEGRRPENVVNPSVYESNA